MTVKFGSERADLAPKLAEPWAPAPAPAYGCDWGQQRGKDRTLRSTENMVDLYDVNTRLKSTKFPFKLILYF